MMSENPQQSGAAYPYKANDLGARKRQVRKASYVLLGVGAWAPSDHHPRKSSVVVVVVVDAVAVVVVVVEVGVVVVVVY